MLFFQSKCEKYWPDSGKKAFGDIDVKLRQETTLSECTVRILDLSIQVKPTRVSVVLR